MLSSRFVPNFVMTATLTLSVAPPHGGGVAPPHGGGVASPSPLRGRPRVAAAPVRAIPANELYSLRARRRFASYLRMRLLELRSEHLERAADTIERRLSVDGLLRD